MKVLFPEYGMPIMKMQSGFLGSLSMVQAKEIKQNHRTVEELDLSNFGKNVKFFRKVAWKMLKN